MNPVYAGPDIDPDPAGLPDVNLELVFHFICKTPPFSPPPNALKTGCFLSQVR